MPEINWGDMVLEYMVTVWDSAEPKTYCHDNVKVKKCFFSGCIIVCSQCRQKSDTVEWSVWSVYNLALSHCTRMFAQFILKKRINHKKIITDQSDLVYNCICLHHFDLVFWYSVHLLEKLDNRNGWLYPVLLLVNSEASHQTVLPVHFMRCMIVS